MIKANQSHSRLDLLYLHLCMQFKRFKMKSWKQIVPIFLLLATAISYGQKETSIDSISKEVVWHVKAIHPEGYTMQVKAIDTEGNKYDVKAFDKSNQRYIMDVKAFVKGEMLPVKVLVSEEEYKPVAAIDSNGKTYAIMAIDKNGKNLEVKGVRKSGYIVHIKAIDASGVFYGVKAISPKGKLNDVKGIKMYDKRLEVTMDGVEVHAHVVALPQIQ